MWTAIGAISTVMTVAMILIGVVAAIKKKKAKRFFGGAAVFFIIMIVAIVNTPAPEDNQVVEALAVAANPAPTVAPDPTPITTEAPKETIAPVMVASPLDTAKDAVHKAFGEINSFDNTDSIQEITLDQGKTLTIKVVGKDNLTAKMILFMMHSNIKDTLKELDGNKDIDTIAFSVLFPMQDKFGQQSMAVVMKAEFSPETRDKIVWENFVSDDIPDIADAYWHNSSFD